MPSFANGVIRGSGLGEVSDPSHGDRLAHLLPVSLDGACELHELGVLKGRLVKSGRKGVVLVDTRRGVGGPGKVRH